MLLTDTCIQSELITVRKQSARERAATEQRQRIRSSLQCIMHSSSNDGESVNTQHINMTSHNQDEAQDYASGIRRSLQVNDNTEVLLGAAWISDEERRRFEMHPEVLAVDVTEQTNKEKRPLLLAASLTPENQTCTVLRALIPSNKKWVYDWFFGTVLPTLLPERARNRNYILLTDGDRNEYDAFQQAQAVCFPNSVHRLCSWHLVNRGMKAARLSSAHLTATGTAYYDVAVKWMKSWASSVESESEFQHSYDLFNYWLSSECVVKEIGERARQLQDYARTKLLPYKSKWVRSHFMFTRCFDRQSSQIVEAENSVLKTHAIGTRCTQPISTSAQVMTELNVMRNDRKRKEAAKSVDARPTTRVLPDIEEYCNEYVVEQLQHHFAKKQYREVVRESHHCPFDNRILFKFCRLKLGQPVQ